MTMYGADSDALEAAANELDIAADEFDRSAGGLSSTLGSLRWLGAVALMFSDLWTSQHNPRMVKTAGFLRENARKLREQAAAQRNASGSDGSTKFGSGSMWDRIDERRAQRAREKELADQLAPELHRARGLTDADQLAWWNGLTDEQRTALLSARPGELIGMNGLPLDVQQTAQDNYTSRISGEIQTSSSSIRGEAEISIKIFKVGGGFELEQRVFKNGSVELEISGYLKAGVGLDELKAMREAGLGGTFEFDSEAEAQQFVKDLAMAAAKGDVLDFLTRNASHLGSIESSTGVDISVGVSGPGGGAEVGVSAEVSASVDLRNEGKGDVTLSASATVSGSANSATLGVSGEVKISASATFDGSTPEKMTFSFSYENAALSGVFAGVGEAAAGATHSGTAEITFDLTQPELRAAADAATAALKRGDVAGATQAFASVMDRAQIVVQQAVGTESQFGIDYKVVKAELNTSTSTTTSTFVKPPGGSFYEVK